MGPTRWGPRVVNPPPAPEPRSSARRAEHLCPLRSWGPDGVHRPLRLCGHLLRGPFSVSGRRLRGPRCQVALCTVFCSIRAYIRRRITAYVTVVFADRSEEHGGGSQGGSVRPPRVWAKAGSGRRRCVSAMRTQAPASSRVCRARGAHPSVARAAYRTWCCPCSQETPRACGTLTGADEVLGRGPAAGKPVRFHGADASSRRGSRSCFFLRGRSSFGGWRGPALRVSVALSSA